MSEHLYVLDFRSSCPDWQVFIYFQVDLLDTLKYEVLNYSRKISQVWDFHQKFIPVGLTLVLSVSSRVKLE